MAREKRADVLHVLRQHPATSQEVADFIGRSNVTAWFQLRALMEEGIVGRRGEGVAHDPFVYFLKNE